MSLLDALEKKFGKWSIPNLTIYLIAGQALGLALLSASPQLYSKVTLIGNSIFAGEPWRILTFLFIPLTFDFLLGVFTWYLYYLYGSLLEKHWGSFRYTLYIAIAVVLTIIASIILPFEIFTNAYIYLSIFLAAAHLYPDFTVLLMFFIPVKLKWLGYFTWAGIIASILLGELPTKIEAFISAGTFLLFFGSNIWYSLTNKSKRLSQTHTSKLIKAKAYHTCTVCGRNEVKDPDMQILYCSDCIPQSCYCELHINNHKHKVVN